MRSGSIFGVARIVAAKDLRIEIRSRVVSNQVMPFAGLVMVMFAFALDNDTTLERVAGGLVWLATLFSFFIIVQRSFAIDTADGALDALRVAGVNPAGIFLGKSIALMTHLFILEVMLVGAAIVLYRVNIQPNSIVLLVTCMICATVGLAFVGTLYGGLAAGMRGRETLLPLLLLPAVAPVLIGATKATEAAFGIVGMATSEGWPWVGLLAVFATVFGVGGLSAFGPLIED
ncbi:MAG: heme exporter protein CcmB [Actinomycetota bacterium]